MVVRVRGDEFCDAAQAEGLDLGLEVRAAGGQWELLLLLLLL